MGYLKPRAEYKSRIWYRYKNHPSTRILWGPESPQKEKVKSFPRADGRSHNTIDFRRLDPQKHRYRCSIPLESACFTYGAALILSPRPGILQQNINVLPLIHIWIYTQYTLTTSWSRSLLASICMDVQLADVQTIIKKPQFLI